MTKVLVVDDERKMRRVLQIQLERMGIDSVPAESGEEALDRFQAEKIDLVLTDLKMPGMSGLELLARVRELDAAVLVTGETGTGKELVAHAIHGLSPRRQRLFVPLNCATIPPDLLESELFGHTRGAFTGAHSERTGKFEVADGGTLFLDEIGDMAYPLQAKLLRVLQEGVIERIGSNKQITLDVRVLSSTHRDLSAGIRAGTFREDLYYRLNVFHVHLPPLRERREDIPHPARFFLPPFSQHAGETPPAHQPPACPLLPPFTLPGRVIDLP